MILGESVRRRNKNWDMKGKEQVKKYCNKAENNCEWNGWLEAKGCFGAPKIVLFVLPIRKFIFQPWDASIKTQSKLTPNGLCWSPRRWVVGDPRDTRVKVVASAFQKILRGSKLTWYMSRLSSLEHFPDYFLLQSCPETADLPRSELIMYCGIAIAVPLQLLLVLLYCDSSKWVVARLKRAGMKNSSWEESNGREHNRRRKEESEGSLNK